MSFREGNELKVLDEARDLSHRLDVFPQENHGRDLLFDDKVSSLLSHFSAQKPAADEQPDSTVNWHVGRSDCLFVWWYDRLVDLD